MAQRKIQYFEADIAFKLPHPPTIIASWIQSIIKRADHQLISLHFIFCSDTYLHAYNVAYLQHDTYTDVITFTYADQAQTVEGEVYISIDRVRENADIYQCPFEEELYRVMIHGVLHLLGYKDDSPTEVSTMRIQEEQCLLLLQGLLTTSTK
jgi:probable rRNA maturation factor